MPHRTTASLPSVLWTFALLGPVFGYLTVMFSLTLGGADSLPGLLRFPLAAVLGAPLGLPMAWFLGVVPAILVGLVYWALRAKAALGALRAIALSAVAAVVVCSGAVVIVDGDVSGLTEVTSWLMMVVPGVVATVFCAGVVEGRPQKDQIGGIEPNS